MHCPFVRICGDVFTILVLDGHCLEPVKSALRSLTIVGPVQEQPKQIKSSKKGAGGEIHIKCGLCFAYTGRQMLKMIQSDSLLKKIKIEKKGKIAGGEKMEGREREEERKAGREGGDWFGNLSFLY